ncbi:putative deoxyhypusine synthase [Candidatus Gugararchaeum adminiculabundum]|nr:putative deoxyhypusine synthase [Candidatus Gugararchaeum adminiculabundum]
MPKPEFVQSAALPKSVSAADKKKLAKTLAVSKKILADKECFKFFSFSGPAIAYGMRELFIDYIQRGAADAVVTSGATVVHDLIESYGGKHVAGTFAANDIQLHKQGFGRMGAVYVEMKYFALFEKKITEIFKDIYKQKDEAKQGCKLSISDFLYEIGKRLPKGKSFLAACAEKNVRVYSPAFQDSMLGLQLAIFNQDHKLIIDSTADMMPLFNTLHDQKKVGAIILGGGYFKHYTLGVNVLRGGIDYAINICSSDEKDGSLSGAKLEEGISWGKASESATLATLKGDYIKEFPKLYKLLVDELG